MPRKMSDNPSDSKPLGTISTAFQRLALSAKKSRLSPSFRKEIILPSIGSKKPSLEKELPSSNADLGLVSKREPINQMETLATKSRFNSIDIGSNLNLSRSSVKRMGSLTNSRVLPSSNSIKERRGSQPSRHPELASLAVPSGSYLNIDLLDFQMDKTYLVGLKNLGNTCYMNSILQSLLAIKAFVGIFLGRNALKVTKPVAKAFEAFTREYFKSTTGVRSPSSLKSAVAKRAHQFYGNGQEDSQEFLRVIINELHNDINPINTIPKFTYTEAEFEALSNEEKSRVTWNRYRMYENSHIMDVFAGQLESIVTCQECFTQSVTYDVFWDLSIPVSSDDSKIYTNLEACLAAYFQEEALEATYKCSKCKENRKATKKLSISRYPSVIVIRNRY